MHLYVFWVPGRGTAWQHTPDRQATHGVLTNYRSVDEAPNGTGWTARRRGANWLVLGFLEFWVESDRGKSQW